MNRRTCRPASECAAVMNPPHPERVCWGRDRQCPTEDLSCGNGRMRMPHPIELFGDDGSTRHARTGLFSVTAAWVENP
ncbi:MAG: DUF3079 domain-containing protein, partial [Vicinamibacterales bacterium]